MVSLLDKHAHCFGLVALGILQLHRRVISSCTFGFGIHLVNIIVDMLSMQAFPLLFEVLTLILGVSTHRMSLSPCHLELCYDFELRYGPVSLAVLRHATILRFAIHIAGLSRFPSASMAMHSGLIRTKKSWRSAGLQRSGAHVEFTWHLMCFTHRHYAMPCVTWHASPAFHACHAVPCVLIVTIAGHAFLLRHMDWTCAHLVYTAIPNHWLTRRGADKTLNQLFRPLINDFNQMIMSGMLQTGPYSGQRVAGAAEHASICAWRVPTGPSEPS